MKNISWDDLQLFLAIAEAGGLSAASENTGLSPATLGRRITRFEDLAGQAFFHRTQQGYRLTDAGEKLRRRAEKMQLAAQEAEEFLSSTIEKPIIRLSAGTGTTQFLIQNYTRLIRPQDAFKLSFASSEALLDLSHRAAEMGIRNQAPEQDNLASLRLGEIAFAPFCARGTDPDTLNWVALDPEQARHPAAHWVLSQDEPIACYTHTVAALHALMRAGIGKGMMPCMIGDQAPELQRAGPVITALSDTQYLVTHNDERHRPPVRRLIDRISALYREQSDLLAGQYPLTL